MNQLTALHVSDVDLPPSWEVAWEASRVGIRAYIVAAVRDLHEAEDLLQEVSLTTARRFLEFRPGTSFGAWGREIARRMILDSARKRKARPWTPSPDLLSRLESAAAELEEETPASELRDALRRCVEESGEEARKLINLRYGQGLPVEQVSGAIGKTTQATYGMLKRLKLALRKCARWRLRKDR